MYRRIVLAGFACLFVLALARPTAAEGTALVFAAASMKDALDAIAIKWKAESGDQATISYAASSALAKQIESGAPANMFISADLDWMDYLAKKNLIDPKIPRQSAGQRTRADRAGRECEAGGDRP